MPSLALERRSGVDRRWTRPGPTVDPIEAGWDASDGLAVDRPVRTRLGHGGPDGLAVASAVRRDAFGFGGGGGRRRSTVSVALVVPWAMLRPKEGSAE